LLSAGLISSQTDDLPVSEGVDPPATPTAKEKRTLP